MTTSSSGRISSHKLLEMCSPMFLLLFTPKSVLTAQTLTGQVGVPRLRLCLCSLSPCSLSLSFRHFQTKA